MVKEQLHIMSLFAIRLCPKSSQNTSNSAQFSSGHSACCAGLNVTLFKQRTKGNTCANIPNKYNNTQYMWHYMWYLYSYMYMCIHVYICMYDCICITHMLYIYIIYAYILYHTNILSVRMSICTPVPRIHETSKADVGYGHHNQKAARILLILLPATARPLDFDDPQRVSTTSFWNIKQPVFGVSLIVLVTFIAGPPEISMVPHLPKTYQTF